MSGKQGNVYPHAHQFLLLATLVSGPAGRTNLALHMSMSWQAETATPHQQSLSQAMP